MTTGLKNKSYLGTKIEKEVLRERYYSNQVDDAFLFIASKIKSDFPELLVVDDDSVLFKYWINMYGKDNTKKINYEKDGFLFNKVFFLKNLYKSLVLLSYLKSKNRLDDKLYLNDIGCGAGVFSLSWQMLNPDYRNNVKLIDSSLSQLTLAEQFLKLFKFNNVELCNIYFPHEAERLSGLRLFSYFFCEQSLRLHNSSSIEKIFGDSAIIIDYPEVIESLNRNVDRNYFTTEFALQVQLKENILNFIREKYINVYGCYLQRR